ncbi:MAG: ribosome small subunit-dependent GTPase A [Actinomycetota bacterium]
MAGPSATVRVGDREVEAPVVPRIPGGPPVVGDRVVLREADGDAVVSAILPRVTQLRRVTGPPGRLRPRTVVANADLLLVVASVVDPPLRPWIVDRYLVAASAGGLQAAVVLTKVDLPHDEVEVGRVAARYRAAGYAVVAGSAREAPLVEAVRDLVGGRVAALAGESGVGKSTLTRGLTGVARPVGDVSERSRQGRHTTTDPRLIPLLGGGAVVDTAGVRSFYLPPMEPDDLAAAFPEIAAVCGECRFDDCRHAGEAGCAVDGRVDPERLESYRRLLASVG